MSLKCCEKQNHKEHATLRFFFFLLTASENVTWHHFHALGVQGQLDQQLLPILDATTADLRQL